MLSTPQHQFIASLPLPIPSPLILSVFLLSAVVHPECCPSNEAWGAFCNRAGTYRCGDCTYALPFCGKGPCNIFGCNCQGGCKQGDASEIIPIGPNVHEEFWRNITANYVDAIVSSFDEDKDARLSFGEFGSYISSTRKFGVLSVGYEFGRLDTNSDMMIDVTEIDGDYASIVMKELKEFMGNKTKGTGGGGTGSGTGNNSTGAGETGEEETKVPTDDAGGEEEEAASATEDAEAAEGSAAEDGG